RPAGRGVRAGGPGGVRRPDRAGEPSPGRAPRRSAPLRPGVLAVSPATGTATPARGHAVRWGAADAGAGPGAAQRQPAAAGRRAQPGTGTPSGRPADRGAPAGGRPGDGAAGGAEPDDGPTPGPRRDRPGPGSGGVDRAGRGAVVGSGHHPPAAGSRLGRPTRRWGMSTFVLMTI